MDERSARLGALDENLCAGQLGVLLLERLDLLAQLLDLQLFEALGVDLAAAPEEVVEQPVGLVFGPTCRVHPDDALAFELSLAPVAAPDQAQHFPSAVPEVAVAGVGVGREELTLPLGLQRGQFVAYRRQQFLALGRVRRGSAAVAAG